ncbi:MAG: type II secretion system inner membrane protein GspF [Bdellovibrionales bacterium]|nr:type II secretion system inner membrane protein GspF [Bdellovibrionales bacterium]
MPVYEYKGLDRAGRNKRGTIDAENSRIAKTRLKKDGIYVIDLKDKTKAAKKSKSSGVSTKGVGVQDLSLMTRQLATLLRANIPLVDALSAVADQVENETLSVVMANVKNDVNEGSHLYKSMHKYPKIFDTIFLSMVEAGEASGTLDVILIRLAEFKEAQSKLNSKVKSAMVYPILMFVFTMLLLGILFIFVIPKITAVFESNPDLTLPWYTIMVIDFSGILVNYWYMIIGAVAAIYMVFRAWKATSNGRAQYDGIVLKLPVIGKLARMIAVSRFTRTLSTLLTGGVEIQKCMAIVRNVVDNHHLATAIDMASENISEGESIAGPLKKSGQFPPLVIHMVNIGEKTGDLENMLTQVSDSYDFQVENSVDGITALLEPVMIIVMGCVIGIIVFSIMIPMFQMSSLGG